MKYRILTYLITMLCPFFLKAQTNDSLCQSLHEGVFYYYSGAANSHSIYIREGNIQNEVVMETGDTSVWQIDWKDDCNYTLTYLKGQGPIEAVSKAFNNEITINVSILHATADYFVFHTAPNKKTHAAAMQDTLWRTEQPGKLVNRNITDASFPGGSEAWRDYMQEAMEQYETGLSKSKKSGVCLVQFIVDTDGSLTNVKALTMKGTRIARYAVNAIKKGPNWLPGTVNGIPKKMIRVQPVTFIMTEAD